MGRKLKFRVLVGILKDKASMVKATLSPKRGSASIRIAVIRATTRNSSRPPPEHRIAAILSQGQGTRPRACTCIQAIMDRVHRSDSVYVVFKCLIILHNIIARGSFILKDQISFVPSSGGRNFLNLSMFSDKTDVQAWEFSSWVRWYASYLELNLKTSRVLGSYVSPTSSSNKNININKDSENLACLLNSDLLKEIRSLIGLVEEICRAPEALINEQNNLVFEVMRLVGEDYRLTQHNIMIRLSEFNDRINGLKSDELDDLVHSLKSLDNCKEKLVVLFVNRKRNDAFWELISQTETKLVQVKKERENVRAITEAIESSRFVKRVAPPSQLLVKLLPYGGKWLNVDRTVVSTAMV